MAKTLTISVPPNTTVVLPDNDTIQRIFGGAVSILIDNQSGEQITIADGGGSSSHFTIVDVPTPINNGVEDAVELTANSTGDLVFNSTNTVSVEVTAPPSEGVAGAMQMRLGLGIGL